MGGSRFAYRSWKEHRLYGPARMRGQPVIVLGAGEAADSLLREMKRSGLWYAVALASNKVTNQGRWLHGFACIWPYVVIPDLAEKYSVKHAIMAMP